MKLFHKYKTPRTSYSASWLPMLEVLINERSLKRQPLSIRLLIVLFTGFKHKDSCRMSHLCQSSKFSSLAKILLRRNNLPVFHSHECNLFQFFSLLKCFMRGRLHGTCLNTAYRNWMNQNIVTWNGTVENVYWSQYMFEWELLMF